LTIGLLRLKNFSVKTNQPPAAKAYDFHQLGNPREKEGREGRAWSPISLSREDPSSFVKKGTGTAVRNWTTESRLRGDSDGFYPTKGTSRMGRRRKDKEKTELANPIKERSSNGGELA